MNAIALDPRTGEIIHLHDEIIRDGQALFGKAVRIGELLAQKKEELGHGNFGPWLATLPFTDRTARNYMRVFQGRDQLKTETVSGLTAAYKVLGPAKDQPAIQPEDEAFREWWIAQTVAAFKLIPEKYRQGVNDVLSMALDRPMTEAHTRLLRSVCEMDTHEGWAAMLPFTQRIEELSDSLDDKGGDA